MKYLEAENFAELYTKVMDLVLNHYEYETKPRGMKIRECLNVVLVLKDPTNNLFTCVDKKLSLPSSYTKKEMILYLDGTCDSNLFALASDFWNNIKNEDGTINSAYGNLIFNSALSDGRSQFEWAYDSLVKDKDSRQAFMRFNNTIHQHDGVKDLPCTFIGIYHIRDNKLNFTIEMRSNDIVKGLIHDEPSFVLFQWLMYLKLKKHYPELEIGTYTHIANSLHLYESDFDLTARRLEVGITDAKFAFPKNADVIKSNDVKRLIELKVKKQEIEQTWDMPENIDFYNWLLK